MFLCPFTVVDAYQKDVLVILEPIDISSFMDAFQGVLRRVVVFEFKDDRHVFSCEWLEKKIHIGFSGLVLAGDLILVKCCKISDSHDAGKAVFVVVLEKGDLVIMEFLDKPGDFLVVSCQRGFQQGGGFLDRLPQAHLL